MMNLYLKSLRFHILAVLFLLIPIVGWADLQFHQIEPFLNVSDYRMLDDLEPSSSITVVVAKGEYEPARLVIHDTEAWGAISVSVSELKNSAGDTLHPSAIEIRNVKRWRQLIPHAYKKDKAAPQHEVDELLVFDDSEPLKGEWTTGQYSPPLVSHTFKSVLSAAVHKQLWLTIHATESQAAGFYTGFITIESANKKSILPIDINVLPFNLPATDKHFGIFYRGTLTRNKKHVSSEDLLAQLIDIQQHGFNSLVINEHDLDYLPVFIEHYKRAGLNGPIVLNLPKSSTENPALLTAAQSMLDQENIDHYVYGIDEPNSRQRIAQQVALRSTLPATSRIFTSLLPTTDDKLIRRGVSLDWINLNVKAGVDQLKSKTDQDNRIATYYWQSYLEDAPRNRYYTGIYLLKTGLDGAFPYVYQAFHSEDPFVTDTRTLGGSQLRDRRLYKHFNTTYPASGSIIPTIQWESMREGIDDYRYAHLLMDLAWQTSPEVFKNVKSQLLGKAELIKYSESKPFRIDQKFDASSLTNFREWMISRILELQI